MKKFLYISLIFIFAYSKVNAWWFDNKDPKFGMVGLTFAPLLPTGGDGHIFDEGKDAPHAEYGLSGGLDYWKKYGRTYDTHLGLDMKYQQYHFHFGPDESNGQFRFIHFSVPASLQYPIPNYSYMFFKLGVSLSSGNILQKTTGTAGNNRYISKFNTAWFIYPEINIGIDILEEKTPGFYFRAGIDYTFIPISKMGTFEASVANDGIIETVNGAFTPNKFQLKLAIYPIWKKKISILKHGHNCPNPF